MAKKKKDEQTGLEPGADLVSSRIRPVDIQQQEFRTSFRGYNATEVDAFLDRLTEDLAAVTEENKRLKEGLPLGEAGADADAVLRQARAEADAIVRRARADAAAAATGATAAGGGADAMSAVWPFLNREREFLRSLAAMVQEHAEGVKTQARDLQEASKRAAAAPAKPPAAEPSAAEPSAAEPQPASGSAWAATAGDAETTSGKEGSVVSIPPSPVDTPVKPSEEEGKEPSLRELFWGEDA